MNCTATRSRIFPAGYRVDPFREGEAPASASKRLERLEPEGWPEHLHVTCTKNDEAATFEEETTELRFVSKRNDRTSAVIGDSTLEWAHRVDADPFAVP